MPCPQPVGKAPAARASLVSRTPGRVQTRHTSVDGRAVEYLVAGDGPVLVLLHRDGETARDWRWVMPGSPRPAIVSSH